MEVQPTVVIQDPILTKFDAPFGTCKQMLDGLNRSNAHDAERCLRDVIALSTLPAIWSGTEPLRIAESLASALYTTLFPEFVYVSFTAGPGQADIAVAQIDRDETSSLLAEELSPGILDWARTREPDELLHLPNPQGRGGVRVSARPLGLDAEWGVIAAGFAEDGSPTSFQHLVLNVGASQAATAIQNARLLRSLRESEERVRRNNIELDHRLEEIEKAAAELEGSRRAALNVMEDAVLDRELVEDLNRQLRDEIRVRERAEESLKEADRKKDEFLATLAHELRNPLAPIRTGLELMRMADRDWSTVEEVRGMMEGQIRQLARLVDDLLDVSRITRDKVVLRKERVELAAVVQSALDATRPIIEDAGHDLTVTLPSEVVILNADSARLAQILSNLLTNAARYTPDGGRISLTAEIVAGGEVRGRGGEGGRSALGTSERLGKADGKGRVINEEPEGSEFSQPATRHAPSIARHPSPTTDDVVITVRDTGMGIPAEMLERIFEMFSQVDQSLEQSQGGLGIGLTLVKRLVEMHGGSVEAWSEGLGKGSEFSVRLPVPNDGGRVTGGGNSSLASGHSSLATGFRILIVDDNQDAARLLSMVVELLGHESRIANDGAEGIEAAEEFRPEMVLMDLGMPRMNGYDAARRIRETPWGREMFLVALTGWGQEEDRRKTQEAGFDHHLVKPVEPAVLKGLFAELRTDRV